MLTEIMLAELTFQVSITILMLTSSTYYLISQTQGHIYKSPDRGGPESNVKMSIFQCQCQNGQFSNFLNLKKPIVKIWSIRALLLHTMSYVIYGCNL